MEKEKKNRIDRLNQAFKAAKDQRIALTKKEFAEKIGYSRSHLYKFFSGDNDVEEETIIKAENLVQNKTESVSRATFKNPVAVIDSLADAKEYLKNSPGKKLYSADLNAILSQQKETEIKHQAAINILAVNIAQLIAKQPGKNIGNETVELQKAISSESDRLLAEWLKRG